MKRTTNLGDRALQQTIKNLLKEARGGDVPPELAALLRLLPGLTIVPTAQGWSGSVKINEKKRFELMKFAKGWERLKDTLKKKPWQSGTKERSGWDAQTDTGPGNYAGNKDVYVHPSGLNVKLSYGNNFNTGTKTWSISAWHAGVAESLIREAEGDAAPQEESDSLDSQVDRYLAQYEGEAKTAKTEGLDFRMMTRRFLNEAGEDEEDEEEEPAAAEEPEAPTEPTKMTLEDIDLQSFANSVIRLVDNYDSLLEVRSTLARRAINFVAKAYDPDVVEELKRVLRDEHGLIPGESPMDTDAEEFVAPAADRAGSGGEGGAPA